jgi:putative transposase
MPAKNAIKDYKADTSYHLYNRGVEKRVIFLDKQDYNVFLSYLRFYLSPRLKGLTPKVPPSHQLKNYHDQISLLAFCLMPNHYHLLVHQRKANAISCFMRSLCTKYSMYFNKKYERVGGLFQGRYKAVEATSDEQLLYLSKYIHLNPTSLTGTDPAGLTGSVPVKSIFEYRYSSLKYYLTYLKKPWFDPNSVLTLFSQINPDYSYQEYIEQAKATSFKKNSLHLD